MKEENVKQEPSYDFYKLVGKFLRFIIILKSVAIIGSKILLNEPNYVKPYLLEYSEFLHRKHHYYCLFHQ